MRRRPLFWFSLSVLFFICAGIFWHLGDRWAARQAAPRAKQTAGNKAAQQPHSSLLPQPTFSNAAAGPPPSHGKPSGERQGPHTNTNAQSWLAYRLGNTSKPVGELMRSESAILLENALLDTAQGTELSIPAKLRSQGDPGAYIVQSRAALNDAFRARLKEAGASIVSYIPNNAYLVQATAAAARALADQPQTQSVLPYEPYYKLKGPLLAVAVEQRALPEEATLNVLLFADAGQTAAAELKHLGADVVGKDSSPFGPVLRVRPAGADLAAVARVAGVQEVEMVRPRVPANDLSRLRVGVSPDTISLATNNYLGLTGSNILVNVNDTGVDANHPDLTGRVLFDFPQSGLDTNGHGTHVAGIIASSGAHGPTLASGSVAGANYRGMAPGARLFSLLTDPFFGPSFSDSYLQETAAKTNAFISNDSWNYFDAANYEGNLASYDLAAASYDAAVRDALPLVTGPQPVLFVFSAGDYGRGSDDGTLGQADTILSPATAKNVITVGAIEQPRQIVVGTNTAPTNAFWATWTDSDNQVAAFSSRGNVGIGTEGKYGRFKPDLVAPGTFVVSTRSTEWDQASYYTFHAPPYSLLTNVTHAHGLLVPGSTASPGTFDVPANTSQINIRLLNRRSPYPFPDLPIFVTNPPSGPTFSRTNELTIPSPSPTGATWHYTVVNVSTQLVAFDVVIEFMLTIPNDLNSQVLSNLNGSLGADYRYESGTSMSAADVSGVLALMQQFLEAHGRINGWGGPAGRSPALMKAMLINGARNLGNGYDIQVNDPITFQGWGLLQLPFSLHPGLADETMAMNSMWLFDQDPTNALATGDSQTFHVTVADEARNLPLRITLVWSDPPGNPVASLKLVNDLDLVVTNLDTVGPDVGVYFGNDIDVDRNDPWDPLFSPNVDRVNNVENILIAPPLGTNYSITVSGYRVNVSAVPWNPNKIAQDYALVVSCGDGQLTTNDVSISRGSISGTNELFLTVLTNAYGNSSQYFGQTVANQRVGANPALLGTSLVILPVAPDPNINQPPYPNANITVGITNQWTFYVITNTSLFTNAQFSIFGAVELSVPREGVNVLIATNATRTQADVDLYVSTDPGLLVLDPLVVSNAFKDIGRQGVAAVTLTTAAGVPYYLAVKSEDQMAAEYMLDVLFSALPVGEDTGNGFLFSWAEPLPIPDGTPEHPGIASRPLIFTARMNPHDLIRRVIVTNTIAHEFMGDLEGVISYNANVFAVLNNHNPPMAVTDTFVYDDSGEGTVPGARRTEGPGSLQLFAGQKPQPGQPVFFSEEDNATNHIGTFGPFGIFFEKQPPLTAGVTNTILPGTCFSDYVEVPQGAVSMTIYSAVLSGTGPVTLQVCEYNPPGPCGPLYNIGSGVTVAINQFSAPPLVPGAIYQIIQCNNGPDTVQVFLIVSFEFGAGQPQSTSFTNTPLMRIPDDAVSYSTITISNHFTFNSLDVGLLVTNSDLFRRVSDLAITLISPSGQRILLFEDRGRGEAYTIGTTNIYTDIFGSYYTALLPFYTNGFESSLVGPYTPGAIFEGWNVLSNSVYVFPELPAPWLSNNVLMLEYGAVSNALPTTNATEYQLSFQVTHAPYLVGTIGWWPFDGDAVDIFGAHDGLLCGDVSFVSTGKVSRAFVGDGVATKVIVPACPDLDVGKGRGFTVEGWVNPSELPGGSLVLTGAVVMSDGFEGAPATQLTAPTNISGGWHLDAGSIDVLTNNEPPFFGLQADSGITLIDLNGNSPGTISTNLSLAVGQAYQVSFAYARNPDSITFCSNVPQATITAGTSAVTVGPTNFDTWATVSWQQTSFVFQASSPVMPLQARSLTPGACGVLLDSFRVVHLIYPQAPLVEWNDPTNASPEGVEFWLSGLPTTNAAPGILWANLWDTNGLPHLIATTNSVVTNGGWQHVALTFETSTMLARFYTNGHIAAAQVVSRTNFTPRTWSNLYFGYHPAGPDAGASYGGGLDEFGLYDRALTDCEIAAIFTAGGAGKYGTNVLWCPLTNSASGASIIVQINTNSFYFTNGLAWTNGPQWETDVTNFNNPLLVASTNGPGTNLTALVLSGCDPNTTVDTFVLSGLFTNVYDGLMHFTEDTNLAILPIKFAPVPYVVLNLPVMMVFSNDFENATSRVYQAGSVLPGSTNNPLLGPVKWVVTNGPVTVVSNAVLDAVGTNCLALSTNGVFCILPTAPLHRYQLSYTLRGPGVVSWWSGDVNPLDRRAWDLIGGNDGAFVNDATNVAPGFVGSQALYFNGQEEIPPDPDIFPEDIDDPAGVVETADPANLHLTNGFTIEGWIRPIVQTNPPFCGREQLVFRGYPEVFDCSGSGDPYWLALEELPAAPTLRDLHFHIGDAHVGSQGADVFTTNRPIVVGGGPNNGWWHVAAVFDKPVTNVSVVTATTTNTFTTNMLRLYVNGVLIESNYTTISPYADLNPALSPGVALGCRSRYDFTQPYRGYMDEMSIYGRALTDPEIFAIAQAGTAGKANRTVPPALSLAELRVIIDGQQRDVAFGDNAHWQTHVVTFTAARTNAVLALQSVLPGTIIDGITLTEIPAQLNYLPETPLDVLNGEDAYGTWQLEMWDTRAGPGAGLTNDLPTLVTWQLNFQLPPVMSPPVINLQHGISYTNSLAANSAQFFVVNVPQWAIWATNVLEFAEQYGTTNPLPVGVWFNTNQLPTFTTNDIQLLFGSAGSTNLTTNTTASPWITSGQTYYLAVTNPNPGAVTFGVTVWFDITSLTNCKPQTNYVGPAGIPRYFQFDVPTNNLPGLPPASVSFWLTGVQTNVTVVFSEHLPLPDLTHFDYISQSPCTNDEIVMMVTNTTPYSIQTNRWYVGVFNTGATNVSFTVQACYTTQYPTVILLTNALPYIADFAFPTNLFAPPGPPRSLFFQFSVTNWTDGILFELYGLSGDADLVLQRFALPTMAPYFDGSFWMGLKPEQIVVRSGAEIADLRGDWYLGVYNNESTNVAYTIRATVQTNRMLLSGQPLLMTMSLMPSAPGNALLQWNSIEGEIYVVYYTDSLIPPIRWQTLVLPGGLPGLIATTPCSTVQVPILQTGWRFYRIAQVPVLPQLQPRLSIQLWPGNQIRIYWSTSFQGFTLQYSNGLGPPWANVNLPVTVEGNNFVVYDTIRQLPRYYRLIQ